MATSLHQPNKPSAAERLDAMGATGRFAAASSGGLDRRELQVWASLWPEEVPLINGELAWIVVSLADFD